MPRNFVSVQAHETNALILHQTLLGESDVILSLMTEELGRVDAIARNARKSQKRFGGALEPIHTLRVKLDERVGRDLFSLRESQIITPRRTILKALARLEAAGKALSWLRQTASAHTREPELYQRILRLLDALDTDSNAAECELLLAEFGLQLLALAGFGIDFGRCVRCGTECPPERTALLDAVRGGLICQKCGGAPLRIGAAARERFSAATRGSPGALQQEDLPLAMDVVTRSLSSHVGIG